jgi:hypothetical protein
MLNSRSESKMTAAKIARRLMPAFGAITMLAFAAPNATRRDSKAFSDAMAVVGLSSGRQQARNNRR